ncbi:hypothetical protein F4560_004775 [Saccharothrix ecbatanensis]|uniref:TauD/TfdA-like domain-containing protein n=1 Tax=Saccharothrix ecbatanensis TaxID=1105145 RepID=A0A7W9HMG1_9PSEU|nr:TauD/TfdA family dioxygenase [Saccharothrix ecbatanensis]MBB5805007.1 hypothetical protein [Saccharothrix ecbatanensis]
MVETNSGGDGATHDAARLLHEIASGLARAGATSDTVLTDHLERVPAELSAALADVVALPDRTTGWSVASGLLAEFGDPGPTPLHWKEGGDEATRAVDIALVLVGSSLGQVFGWAGQQAGRIVHDIVPSAGYEDMQVGASSTTALAWHTEDAFHPDRPDLLMLACFRNHDRVGSLLSSIRRVVLDERDLVVLSRPDLVIVPDDSYPGDWSGGDLSENAMATVWRADDGLCLRYDPSYTRFLTDDAELRAAYDRLGEAIDASSEEVPIQAGDILLVDNDIAVHGRAAYRARFDGTDRWLKRVLVRLDRPRPAEQRSGGYDQAMVRPTFRGPVAG